MILRLLIWGLHSESHGSRKWRKKDAYFEDHGHMSSRHPSFPLPSLSCFFPSSFVQHLLLEHRVWPGLTRWSLAAQGPRPVL